MTIGTDSAATKRTSCDDTWSSPSLAQRKALLSMVDLVAHEALSLPESAHPMTTKELRALLRYKTRFSDEPKKSEVIMQAVEMLIDKKLVEPIDALAEEQAGEIENAEQPGPDQPAKRRRGRRLINFRKCKWSEVEETGESCRQAAHQLLLVPEDFQ